MNCQPKPKQLVYNWLNFDQSCLLCDARAAQAYPMCMACEQELPWLEEYCLRCALPLPMADLVCAHCSRRAPAFEQVIAPWHYGFPLDTMISRFKHNRQWPLGRLMAEMLSINLQHRFADGLLKPGLLLPVPLAKRRQRERGFNQASMLAGWVSKCLDIRCDERLLLRTRDTPAQQDLNARARQRNLRGAFSLADQRSLEGLHVAVVDDVMTTGATAQAIANLLRKAGAGRVDIYCLARTPKPGQA
ncbi:ComF family protein [Pseudomonas sp. PSKL.D1]|uniref:ComF family protein n=1 Tax=Pseudomonas sp. PSKL.D1 TaxID=3029060 RepID=UPI0023816AF2|nr:ComF family protein [Pseudomonas sp. PSKL.D1]WDY57671.1 ComF family protein [Pseudomonas sp. PSKL.D1]